MPNKPTLSNKLRVPRRRAADKQVSKGLQRAYQPLMAQLYQRAETRLGNRPKLQRSNANDQNPDSHTARVFHELEAHQIELEMQNARLKQTRNELEEMLEKSTDLYDFAPVGYLSVDDSGAILEANLTSAFLLGIERSRLIKRRLPLLVSLTSRPGFLDFLERVFSGPTNQSCEALLQKEGGGTFWAGFRATPAVSPAGTEKWCRITFGDITSRKQAEEAQHRIEVLAATNRKLEHEIARRQAVEESLKQTQRQHSRLLEQSRQTQKQLRCLSHQLLSSQEDERKRISRELHDVIAQTLTSINLRLAILKKEATLSNKGLERSIARTQELVAHSVDIVHRFARELRPTALDDLGLIPALHTFMKNFTEQTGIRVSFSVSPAVEQLNGDKRTVIYRVAQEALTNVARHAKASRAEVRIQKRDGSICLEVIDNGKGLPADRVFRAKNKQRFGLLGMKERVEMVNGNLTVQSTPGKRTSIQVQIPLAENGDKRFVPATPERDGSNNPALDGPARKRARTQVSQANAQSVA